MSFFILFLVLMFIVGPALLYFEKDSDLAAKLVTPVAWLAVISLIISIILMIPFLLLVFAIVIVMVWLSL